MRMQHTRAKTHTPSQIEVIAADQICHLHTHILSHTTRLHTRRSIPTRKRTRSRTRHHISMELLQISNVPPTCEHTHAHNTLTYT